MADGVRFTKQSTDKAVVENLDASIKERKQQLIEAVDKVKESPDNRAMRVYNVLKINSELTNWDIICFCSQFLASQIHALPWLKVPVKHLSQLIYTQHYVMIEGDGKDA